MHTSRLAVSTAIALLTFVPFTAAEPATFDELVDTLAPLVEKIEAYSSDVQMTMSMGGMTMTFGGTMRHKGEMNDNTMNMDMFGQKMSMRMVTDNAGAMWMDMDMMGERMVMKTNAAAIEEMNEEMLGSMPGMGMMGGGAVQEDPRQMLEELQKNFELVPMGTEDLDGTKVYVVSGVAREGISDTLGGGDDADDPFAAAFMGVPKSVRAYIGADDGFPRKVEMLGDTGSPMMTIAFRNVLINQPMDDSLFTYTPPDGVEVMDMSDMLAGAFDDPGGFDDSTDSGYNAKMKVGDVAPDFDAPASDGGTISLSDYRGKVVLIDFWASWCGPCVAEMPNVIEAYEAFHAAGLEIIGVNLDDEKSDIDEFIAERPGMTWRHVFAGKGWGSEVGDLYGVDAIPFALLLDKDGTIVARDLRGDALKAEIGKLLED